MSIRATSIESDEQWHAMRAGNVGASEVAALLRVHPYQTPLGLYSLKSGKTPRAIETGPMRRGKKLEPVAVELIRDEQSTWDLKTPQTYYEDTEIKLGATPDLFATAPEPHGFGIVQIKTVEPGVFRRTWFDEHDQMRPPDWIAIQAIVEAHLTGAKWAAVAALVIGHGIDLHLIDVPVHARIIQRVRAETALFWQRVESGSPPEPDFGKDGSLIGSLFRQDDGAEIDLSGDNELPEILQDRMQAADLEKYAQTLKKDCDARLLHKLGAAAVGKFNGGYLSAKTINRKAYSVAASSYRQVRIVQKDQAA